jgi:shikimate dehydrogenase
VRHYAVTGSPIAHSLSPRMQLAAFVACNIEASYQAFEATHAGPIFKDLRSRNYDGWNVTTPLKEQALACVDRLTPIAAAAKAVNVVRREGQGLVGHNTDGAGFVRAVEELWPGAVLRARILILGSGPAARAIALELRSAGVTELFCWSRNLKKAETIAPAPRFNSDLIVCALPPKAVPEHMLALASGAEMVFDLNYGARAQSQLLASVAAPKRSDGLPLLLHQGILSFEWWTGVAAPVAAMRAAIKCPAPGR